VETGRNLAWFYIDSHPQEAARVLERLEPGEVAALLQEAPLRLATRLLLKMAPSAGAASLAELEPDRAAEILEDLPAEIAAGLLRPLAAERRARFLDCLSPEASQPLITLLRYSDQTAGALMDTRALSVPRDSAVRAVRDLVQRHASRTLYYVYVVDDERRLVGVVTLRQLMLAAAGDPITSIMRADPAALPATADRLGILAHPGWRQVHALPVVDRHGAMLGVVSYETLRRLEDEAAAVQRARALHRAALELGEIYWLSIGRLVASLGGVPGEGASAGRQGGAGHEA